ncbi:hypothetical protein L5515_009107 [Caenorhabditis briggsae]|uniref:Uncharacterized protein n=1 Tax=Caenorhabditis briggsae TaxID=6238 RepID=A0AAE9ABN7_CAEBR|nr:hypothetical protein L3Y34_009215 [Caenorhabditis briggsae]UMM37317.1 hypothetical protein L5515_009107 [Caenorhabditis briggsae]
MDRMNKMDKKDIDMEHVKKDKSGQEPPNYANIHEKFDEMRHDVDRMLNEGGCGERNKKDMDHEDHDEESMDKRRESDVRNKEM